MKRPTGHEHGCQSLLIHLAYFWCNLASGTAHRLLLGRVIGHVVRHLGGLVSLLGQVMWDLLWTALVPRSSTVNITFTYIPCRDGPRARYKARSTFSLYNTRLLAPRSSTFTEALWFVRVNRLHSLYASYSASKGPKFRWKFKFKNGVFYARVAYIREFSQCVLNTKERDEKTLEPTAGLLAEIPTHDLQNTEPFITLPSLNRNFNIAYLPPA
jgi:hypothetical protein